MSKHKRRIVLIGLDGAPYSLMEKLSDQGVMPHFKSLRDEGVFRQMKAPLPDNSAVSWSSIMTGTNPGVHGIFGFTDLIPNTYTLGFPNFNNLKALPFWKKEPDRNYIIINLPFTYPASEINGKLVAGFVSPTLEKAVYPDSFFQELSRLFRRTWMMKLWLAAV